VTAIGRITIHETYVEVSAVESFQTWTLRRLERLFRAAVDRYGITTTAEQYAGFLQLETTAPNAGRGRKLVEQAGGLKQALLTNHPDQGGDPRRFADVQAYRSQVGR
jgi:hypothetical protein